VLYALSAPYATPSPRTAPARLWIDLRPDARAEALEAKLAQQPASQSAANRLRKAVRLTAAGNQPAARGARQDLPADPAALAKAVKGAPLQLTAIRPLDRAISTAGGWRSARWTTT